MRAWGGKQQPTWNGGKESGTVYGFVFEGTMTLTVQSSSSSAPKEGQQKERSFMLYEGMYFASPGRVKVSGGAGILQLVDHHRAMFSMGGPLEENGRLAYIDGCTDSLLLSPAIKGAPCLNHLHFPPSILQTQHTHPSGRSGIVVRGRGTCIYSKI